MTGVYGKLPLYGDFVRRELPQNFVQPWDAWLQDCLAQAREQLGITFDAVWDAAPPWRFRLPAGVCGSAAVVGVLITSEDMVGRKFPITVATLLPDDSLPPNQAWYAALEAAAWAGRERGDTVDALLATLPTAALRRSFSAPGDIPAPGWWTADGRRLELMQLPSATQFQCQLLGAEAAPAPTAAAAAKIDDDDPETVPGPHLVRLLHPPAPDTQPPALPASPPPALAVPTLELTGLPAALAPVLRPVAPPMRLSVAPPVLPSVMPPVLPSVILPVLPTVMPPSLPSMLAVEPLASRAVSHRGTVRSRNEDAFVDRGDIGVWAVADGAGGHGAGDVASAAAAAAIADLPVGLSAAEILAQVRLRLSAVHADLQRRAAANGNGEIMATTIVVLMARGDHFACLWAGDSRAYLLREGMLSQITRDHSLVQEMVESGSLAPEDAEHHPQANVITRAVGSHEALHLDKVSGRIHPGDVLLLCTDGLFKALPVSQIAQSLALGAGPEPLLQQALRAGARDNVTALIVEV